MELDRMQNILEDILDSDLKDIKSITFDFEKDEVNVVYEDNGIEKILCLDRKTRDCNDECSPEKWICNHCDCLDDCKNDRF